MSTFYTRSEHFFARLPETSLLIIFSRLKDREYISYVYLALGSLIEYEGFHSSYIVDVVSRGQRCDLAGEVIPEGESVYVKERRYNTVLNRRMRRGGAELTFARQNLPSL